MLSRSVAGIAISLPAAFSGGSVAKTFSSKLIMLGIVKVGASSGL
jgi:hypothetical protein